VNRFTFAKKLSWHTAIASSLPFVNNRIGQNLSPKILSPNPERQEGATWANLSNGRISNFYSVGITNMVARVKEIHREG